MASKWLNAGSGHSDTNVSAALLRKKASDSKESVPTKFLSAKRKECIGICSARNQILKLFWDVERGGGGSPPSPAKKIKSKYGLGKLNSHETCVRFFFKRGKSLVLAGDKINQC